jgi:hypothetical protein
MTIKSAAQSQLRDAGPADQERKGLLTIEALQAVLDEAAERYNMELYSVEGAHQDPCMTGYWLTSRALHECGRCTFHIPVPGTPCRRARGRSVVLKGIRCRVGRLVSETPTTAAG